MKVDQLQRSLGELIRVKRTGLGLSQEEFAERAQLHRTYIGSVERGERNLSLRNLVRLADALHCSASGLLGEAEGQLRLGQEG